MISNDTRLALGAMADYLIPSAGGMPSATSSGVLQRLEDVVFGLRPDVQDAIVDAASYLLGEDGQKIAIEMNGSNPALFRLISSALAATYYMGPAVRALLHYPGQLRKPVEPNDLEPESDRRLLEPVVARGEIYRT